MTANINEIAAVTRNGTNRALGHRRMQDTANQTTAMLASLDQLVANVLPQFIDPIPCRVTLRAWLDSAKVPRFKANPTAKRGGGPVFYSVSAVEKMLRSRTLQPA